MSNSDWYLTNLARELQSRTNYNPLVPTQHHIPYADAWRHKDEHHEKEEQHKGHEDMHKKAFRRALLKLSHDLTTAQREHIAPKNFALTPKQSDTGKPAYPIEDKAHAANALARVKQHGTPSQQSEVYKDVARKYPELASRSDVPALKARVKEAGFTSGIAEKLGPKFKNVAKHLADNSHKYDLAGLGVLGTVPAYEIAHEARKKGPADKGALARAGAELAGLGTLAAPSIAKLVHH